MRKFFLNSIEEEKKNSSYIESAIINKVYISSLEYRAKICSIHTNERVNNIIYKTIIRILKHRNGTLFEDMYLIHKDTGKILGVQIHSNSEKKITYNKSIIRAIAKNKNEKCLIAIHNHPESMPPSDADVNAAIINNYYKSLVVCHDGTVFEYSKGKCNNTIKNSYYKKKLETNKDICYNSEYIGQFTAIEKLSREMNFRFREVNYESEESENKKR
ncbi:MAG: hypothetical protein RR988_03825 [Clostridia bacterium]